MPSGLRLQPPEIWNSERLFRDWGFYATQSHDKDGMAQLAHYFQKENPLYRVGVIDLSRGETEPAAYGRILLCHPTNVGVVTLRNDRGGPYVNKDMPTTGLVTGPHDSFYLAPGHTAAVHSGMLAGLAIGFLGADGNAAGYRHHMRRDKLAIDPIQPDMGCGLKRNHFSTKSIFQERPGQQAARLPERMWSPNWSTDLGAHNVMIGTSRVHEHDTGELYANGDGVLFGYRRDCSDVIAIPLRPNTVVYITKHDPPPHGAVASDVTDPKGTWVFVPGEWQPERFRDAQIGDSLPRPQNAWGQEYARRNGL